MVWSEQKNDVVDTVKPAARCGLFGHGRRGTLDVLSNKPMDMHCVRQVLLNQALHAPFVPLALSEASWTGWHVLWQLPAIYALSDVIFFALHRLAHTKWLYRHVHRVHHEFDSPIPESSLYAHPLEHLLVNAVTVGVHCAWFAPTLSWSGLGLRGQPSALS